MKKKLKKDLKKFGYSYVGVDDNGLEYGEYIEFPDLLSLNSQLNKSLCRSDRSITLRSVAFYINGRII